MFGVCHVFKAHTSAHYLRGYIGDDDYNIDWLRESTLMWKKKIGTISETVGKYPQKSYAVVVRAIQSKWIFLQRFTWDTGDVFMGVEEMIWKHFCLVFSLERQKPSHPS